jgi:hypothetical protein
MTRQEAMLIESAQQQMLAFDQGAPGETDDDASSSSSSRSAELFITEATCKCFATVTGGIVSLKL